MLMQGRKLPNSYRNLIPNFRSCVRESFLGIFKIILWNLKIFVKVLKEWLFKALSFACPFVSALHTLSAHQFATVCVGT